MQHDSIVYSSIRALFVTLFVMIGITLGLIPLFILIGSFTETSNITGLDIETTYTQEIVANAEGKRKDLSKDAPVILKLNIDGTIGLDHLSMDAFQQQLIESREGSLKDNRVKAVLLHINSPGGSAIDSDAIYRAIKAYKEQYKVPVYAYVDGLCASGGMYVACAADKIFATDASIIGSVGVITTSFFNVSQLIDKIGVQSLTVYAGKDKDDLNPFRPWKPGEQDMIQDLINYFYQQFVDVVATSRNIDKKKLIDDFGAKVFNPVQAKENGFINENGATYSSTLKQLLKDIGIEDDYYLVVQLKKKTWFSELFKSEWSLLQGKITHHIQLTPEVDSRLANQILYLYRPEF